MNRKQILVIILICFACICKAQVNNSHHNHQNKNGISYEASIQTETPLSANILAITFPTQIDSSVVARTIATPINLKDLEKMNELIMEMNKQQESKPEDKSSPKKK